jgi:hypothetical protein
MISSFSDAGYLIRRRPHPRRCFFQQTVFECQVGNAFLQGTGFAAQVLHFAGGRSAGGVPGRRRLPASMNSFGPGVIQALSDAFLAAQLGNAVLATQAVEHDTDLVLGRKMAPGLAPDVLHHPLSRGLPGDFFKEGWGFIFVPSSLRRAPNLLNSQPQICAIGADGGQSTRAPRGLLGNNGSITRHSKSVRSYRLMPVLIR